MERVIDAINNTTQMPSVFRIQNSLRSSTAMMNDTKKKKHSDETEGDEHIEVSHVIGVRDRGVSAVLRSATESSLSHVLMFVRERSGTYISCFQAAQAHGTTGEGLAPPSQTHKRTRHLEMTRSSLLMKKSALKPTLWPHKALPNITGRNNCLDAEPNERHILI